VPEQQQRARGGPRGAARSRARSCRHRHLAASFAELSLLCLLFSPLYDVTSRPCALRFLFLVLFFHQDEDWQTSWWEGGFFWCLMKAALLLLGLGGKLDWIFWKGIETRV